MNKPKKTPKLRLCIRLEYMGDMSDTFVICMLSWMLVEGDVLLLLLMSVWKMIMLILKSHELWFGHYRRQTATEKTAQETIVVCHVLFSFCWFGNLLLHRILVLFFFSTLTCLIVLPASSKKHILGNVILDAILWHRAIFYLEMIYAPSCVLSG